MSSLETCFGGQRERMASGARFLWFSEMRGREKVSRSLLFSEYSNSRPSSCTSAKGRERKAGGADLAQLRDSRTISRTTHSSPHLRREGNSECEWEERKNLNLKHIQLQLGFGTLTLDWNAECLHNLCSLRDP